VNSTSVSPASRSNEDALRDTRARAWAFVFECYGKKEAAPESRPNDAKGRSVHDSRASTDYTG